MSSPPASRASQRGTWRGGLAPSALVVDDVVDGGAVVFEGEHGRGGGVVEVDPREDAATVADDREPPLAHGLDQPVAGAAVEAAVAKSDPTRLRDRLVDMAHRGAGLARRCRGGGVERIVLGLDRPTLARVAVVGEALGDKAAHAG